MYFKFDTFGRFCGTSEVPVPYSTPVEPPEQNENYNWTGASWSHAPDIHVVPMHSAQELPPISNFITKRAFQNRFPVAANSVSNLYDIMYLYLSKEEYAISITTDASTRLSIQMILTTGMNRLNASDFVNLDLNEAADFTQILMQPVIPIEFRLTVNQRDQILSKTIRDDERYFPT